MGVRSQIRKTTKNAAELSEKLNGSVPLNMTQAQILMGIMAVSLGVIATVMVAQFVYDVVYDTMKDSL